MSYDSGEHKISETTHMSYNEIAKHLTLIEQCREILTTLPKSNESGENETLRAIKGLYLNVFQGIGRHKYRQVKLTVDDNVQPFVQHQRKYLLRKGHSLMKFLISWSLRTLSEKLMGQQT